MNSTAPELTTPPLNTTPSPTPRVPLTERITKTSLRHDILFAFALALGLYVAWRVRDVLLLLYVSALFAVVLGPLVKGVMRLRIGSKHPTRVLAIFLLVFGLLLMAGLFLSFTLPPIVRDLTNFAEDLPKKTAELELRVRHIPLLRHVNLTAISLKLKNSAIAGTGDFLTSLGDWAAKLADIVTGIILTIYFLIEGEGIYTWVLSMVPEQRRERLDTTLQRAAVRMGRWLLGQSMLMLILALTSGVVFFLLHVRYGFALAILLGVANLIPVMGAMVVGSLALLAAAMDSITKMLGVLAFGLIYAQVENGFLTPRIMQSSVDLSGTAVIVALLLGLSLAGVAGAMVAVPTAVLVAVLMEEYAVQKAPMKQASEPEQ